MKTIKMILVAMLIALCNYATNAQCNYVPNGGFEEAPTFCTGVAGNLLNLSVPGWSQFSTMPVTTPDLFRICSSTTDFATPANICGNQVPAEGNSYAGILSHGGGLPFPDGREYIQVKLNAPLKVGVRYQISYKTSLAENSYSATPMGIALNTTPYFNRYGRYSAIPTPTTLPGGSYSTSSVILDTDKWTTISFYYTPIAPGVQYLIIGNFDITTKPVKAQGNGIFGTSGGAAYYYIDDVSVKPEFELTLPSSLNLCDKREITPISTPSLALFDAVRWEHFNGMRWDLISTSLSNPTATLSGKYRLVVNLNNCWYTSNTCLVTLNNLSLSTSQISCDSFCFSPSCPISCFVNSATPFTLDITPMSTPFFTTTYTGFWPLFCHKFTQNGSYIVKLSYIDCNGNTKVLSQILNVDCPCLVNADFKSNYAGDLATEFYDNSQLGTSTNIVAYSWDFGDGTTSSEANPVHTYLSSGTYRVCMYVFASTGVKGKEGTTCCSQICYDVVVPDEAPCSGCPQRKIVDNKGISKIRNTYNNTAGDITVYPNPAYSSISIDYLLDTEGNANLEIINSEGVVLVKQVLDTQTGSIKLDISNFADGLYICRIYQTGKSAKTAKFSVVKH